ncbi:MAG: DUF2628 domain-containing protein [Alphaproteobacteria bacterium]|nr:DUF2628 domain-containing protein [Alphaproteobacteria bacterium]
MRLYTVHRRPTPAAAEPDLVLIKEGFAWPAFLLAPLWCLWHRQWLALLAYLVGLAAAGALASLLDEAGQAALGLGYHWLVGASANDWRRQRLAAAGYRLGGVVAAAGIAEAEARLFRDQPPRWAGSAATEAPPVDPSRPPLRAADAAAPLAPWSP